MQSSQQLGTRFALAWLGLGCAIMLLAPHSIHNEALGWTATYWLLGAPVLGMLVLSFRPRSQDASCGERLASMRVSNSRMMRK